jgi:thioredoxin 1
MNTTLKPETDSPIATSDATFAEDVVQSKIPVLVDFWAPWCGPCRMVAPVLDELAKEFKGRLKIVKVDVDQCPQTAVQFSIRSIPTLLFFKDGQVAGQTVGAVSKRALIEKVTPLLG